MGLEYTVLPLCPISRVERDKDTKGGGMRELLSRFWSDDQGQDLIEYALMLTLILLVSVAAVEGIGTQVSSIFVSVNSSLGTT